MGSMKTLPPDPTVPAVLMMPVVTWVWPMIETAPPGGAAGVEVARPDLTLGAGEANGLAGGRDVADAEIATGSETNRTRGEDIPGGEGSPRLEVNQGCGGALVINGTDRDGTRPTGQVNGLLEGG